MSSEIPCAVRNANPTGSSNFTGVVEERPGHVGEDDGRRQQEADDPEHVDPQAGASRDVGIDQVDPDMLVDLERVGSAQEKDAREHVPLDLEPGIGADAEEIAAAGIAGADQAGDQHQPTSHHAEPRIDPIDRAADCQERLHRLLLPARSPVFRGFIRTSDYVQSLMENKG